MSDHIDTNKKFIYAIHAAKVAVGLPTYELPASPTPMPADLVLLRMRMFIEEVFEKVDAAGLTLTLDKSGKPVLEQTHAFDLVEFADACADVAVLNTGDLLHSGIDEEKLLAYINDNNMSKLEGTVTFNDIGKLQKPATYVKPNVAEHLAYYPKIDKDDDVSTLRELHSFTQLAPLYVRKEQCPDYTSVAWVDEQVSDHTAHVRDTSTPG